MMQNTNVRLCAPPRIFDYRFSAASGNKATSSCFYLNTENKRSAKRISLPFISGLKSHFIKFPRVLTCSFKRSIRKMR